ncbi:adenosine deaminase domain-containing protein 1 isoform X2 [Kryptolebias marmoratus]|uniref:adenosine deaminase domain-containing protein 1 isoform X2 n=1 Tax=Kryptolebias marmoratus TaxID=37003 RepID=UPI000D52FCD3|nr:adenosine deaminase domain-containing protein 1 isoform X2 [Kryptolebias marmoratus]
MFPARGLFRGSRGASYAQMFMKCTPSAAEVNQSCKPPSAVNGADKQVREPLKPGAFVTPDSLHKKLIDRYKNGETNAVSLVHQLAQVLQFHLEFKETVATDAPPPLPVKEEPSVSDIHQSRAIYERKKSVNLQIPQAVRDQLTKLMDNHPEFSSCAGTTAAFIIQTSGECDVVALGTGNFNAKECVSSDGRIVHDSHAVVTARRSLMRYLYRHLLLFFNKNANLKEKSVFQRSSSSNLLSLKSGVSLHLYVNQLPKGASQIPTKLRLNPLSISAWQVNNEIGLHLSVEGKVFSVFSSGLHHSASNMVSMSSTDKITQWQVLGYQGALLSHFIEPIYVQSILVGDSCCCETRGMEISVSQRVEGITSQLPMFYCMLRPQISLVPSAATCSPGSDEPTFGVNWSEGDSSVEVVDGLEGKTIDESPFKSGAALASRLCKAAMLHRFKLVAKEAQREDLLITSSYAEAKRMAKTYQEAKNMLHAYLCQQGFGSWLEKVSLNDNFSM